MGQSLLIALALGAAAAARAEPPPLVAAMLANATPAAAERCAYTRRSEDRDGSKKERYDPLDAATPWRLLAVDDRPPSAEERQDYWDDAEDRADRRHPLVLDLREMVVPGAWTLVRETPDVAVFEFDLRPNDELNEDVAEKVRGTLTIDRDTAQPVELRLENTEPAYVAPFVRIADYSQTMTFEWNEAIDAAALVETVTHRRGRALLFKSLDKDKRVRYSDYQCSSKTVAESDRHAG